MHVPREKKGPGIPGPFRLLQTKMLRDARYVARLMNPMITRRITAPISA